MAVGEYRGLGAGSWIILRLLRGCSDVGLVDITFPFSQYLYECVWYSCLSCCGGSSNAETVSVGTVCVDVKLLEEAVKC